MHSYPCILLSWNMCYFQSFHSITLYQYISLLDGYKFQTHHVLKLSASLFSPKATILHHPFLTEGTLLILLYLPVEQHHWKQRVLSYSCFQWGGEGVVSSVCPCSVLPHLCNPMDCSLPGSSAHKTLQARILEWVAISYSRGSSQPREPATLASPALEGRFFTTVPLEKPIHASTPSLTQHLPNPVNEGIKTDYWTTEDALTFCSVPCRDRSFSKFYSTQWSLHLTSTQYQGIVSFLCTSVLFQMEAFSSRTILSHPVEFEPWQSRTTNFCALPFAYNLYNINKTFIIKCVLHFLTKYLLETKGFPGGWEVNASAWNAGDQVSIPGSGRSPGEGNGNHSSILAWRIPWTEEPGRLQSMGLQRVGHD